MFRFIQLSGMRLGAAPRPMGPAALPEPLADELQGDAARAFAGACALAREHRVDAVLAVGLTSPADCTAEDIATLYAQVADLAAPFVVLADAAEVAPGGPLHPRTGAALGFGPPPANFSVLTKPRILCDHALVPDPARFVPELPSVLLTAGQAPGDGWAWVAAGGAAEPAVLFDEGRALGGDPGAAWAHELPGPVGGAWLVELEGARAEFTALATAPRRGWNLELDVTSVTRAAELAELARRALDRVGARPADLAWFRLTGAWRIPALPALSPDALRGRIAHAALVPAALTLSPPTGTSTADLHLRALMARSEDGLEALRLALSAWQGGS